MKKEMLQVRVKTLTDMVKGLEELLGEKEDKFRLREEELRKQNVSIESYYVERIEEHEQIIKKLKLQVSQLQSISHNALDLLVKQTTELQELE